jgi:hypothetical protein
MKIASKVFIIIAMCAVPFFVLIGFIEFTAIESMIALEYGAYESAAVLMAGLVLLVISGLCSIAATEVVGGVALKKLSVAKTKNDLIAIGICTIIFCSLLGGIFMLCIPETEL